MLISITGGRDLTLYEVDEAATRIREEVDQEANIIVGATFDEGLEGIIRVSVVATGIDHIVAQRQAAPAESRMAEAAQRARPDVHRGERPELMPARPAGAPPAHAANGPNGAVGAIEQAAAAAIAAATHAATGIEDVKIRPLPPKPSLFLEPPTRGAGTTAGDATPVRSASAGALPGAHAAHAAYRGAADPGAERASGQAR